MTPLQLFPEQIANVLGLEGLLGQVVGGVIGAVFVAVVMLSMTALAGPWAKRKITAAFTDRFSVERVGPWGLGTIIVDSVRLLSKELIIPDGVERPSYDLAPLILPASAILGFAVIPMGDLGPFNIHLADPEVGLVLVFAFASIASISLVMGGYASNNKYSLLGSLRAVAQNIAYEIPLILAAMSVVIFAGTLQLGEIVAAQQTALFTIAGFEIPAWYAIVNPFAFVLFLTASMAEIGRNPFDIPEAPTEIVAGYQTEYSSVYFVLFYLGEFLHIFLGGAILATVFLGGPAGPVLPGFVWFIIKIWAFFLLTQWLRSAIPRVRIDQLIEIGWKGLLVLALANLVLTAVIVGVIV
ncbi:NADH-quinone oxidoreductase subunit H [Halalkaliarchaeum desulfuricum]|uniref:NADH-quinone oxidoreductase subunit H n=1 Tax=Halalkaliarchaeum desulfuricum TaxID=2055893 RepID=A0A343TL04_9EURY|nr:complex I subunit 1 family protein [Halalkaliarchaeum desulfuricum]AUX09776.1 NADH-quinone oxidoreductase subunit H [Halalkaliarchaeum desulfuricum]